jgi:prepilin-type processing-associated H-X9-DG protein
MPGLRFRLIDLLGLVTFCAIFMGIGWPYLHEQIFKRRLTGCQENLRHLGVGLWAHMDVDPAKRFCSGAFDYNCDGPPDKVGWVHDLIKHGTVAPGQLLCEGNNIRGPSALNDWIAAETATAGNSGAVSAAVARGYNTNYSQSWFLARSTIRVDSRLHSLGDQRAHANTFPGLTLRSYEKTSVSGNTIPFLGDMAADRGALPLSTMAGNLPAGTQLGSSFGNGATSYDPVTKTWLPFWLASVPGGPSARQCFEGDHLPLPSAGSDGGVDVDCDGKLDPLTPTLYGGVDQRLFLQDLSNFRAVHRDGWKHVCNILFGDGSVRGVADPNGDGALNPGFLSGPNERCEVGPAEVYSGCLLNQPDFFPTACFVD